MFSESAREYTIKFVGFNADGTEKVLDTQKVAYGTSVTYSCDTPTKASTESTEYTFSGWDTDSDGDADVTTEKVSVEVKSDLTYKAVFAESARKYTIKFVNWDNTLLENGEFVLEYGATPAYNGTPTRPEDNYNTYEFKGWDPAVTPVTGEKTYKATYTETAKSYTVKFLDADGNQVYSTSLGYMATSKYEEKPEKAQSAQYTYEFKGWDLVIENDKGDGEVDSEDGSFTVEGNATYVPLYNEITRSYTITWLDENGNTLTDGTQSLPFGAHEPHAALTKDKSAQYTYTFAGWNLLENNTYDDEIEIKADAARFEVTGDATYKAVFTSTVNKYTVTWIIDGEETKVEYEYGATPTHENPVKESTATTDYTFRNWNPEIAMVESDATYTAEFTGTAREYTVIWNVDDKKTTEQVANGVAIPQPADPVKEHYTFAGWTPAVPDAMPTEDVTFTATWTPVEYTIQWDTDGNGTAEENETQKLAYNTSHDAKTGRRETNSKYSYTFIGWDANSDKTVDVTPGAKITVKGDATYTALFSETPVEHTITINANGGTCTTTAIKQGYSTAVAEPAISREGYTFAGWYKDESKVEFPVTMPDYDMTLKAEWTAIEYTIAFNTDSGSEVENITQGYETEITSLPVTTRNGYTFQGWYDGENKVEASEENPLKMPLNGMTLTAKWKANTYKLIYHSNYGDPETIQEQEIKIGETISSMYSGFTREGYAFLGWSKDPAVTEPTYKADSGYSHGEAKNVDLYAVWQVRQYTITFDSDGGSPVAPIGAAYLSTINEPTEPTKTGHSFAGWDANGDKQADEFPETMPLNGGNMTALWTVNSYKVTFVDVDVEGNQTPWHDAGELAYNSKIDVAKLEGYTDPSRETTKYYEYKFEGWDSDDADNEADQELIVADRDMTFVAVYSQKGIEYTIYWDIDGDSTPDEIEKVPYGDRIVAPTAKEKPGYTAVGWSYAGGEIPKTMPARDLMFVAEYEINKYTITFDAGEGKFDNGESKYEVTGIYQSAVTAPVAPTRVGYRFTGWNVEVPSVMPAESMTVTANWELEDATFIFYNEDGRIYQSVVVDENVSQIEKPADPAVKDGYRFVAWVDKDNQEVAFPINGDALENGIAMYPKVEAIAYMITIDENGGDEVADITAAYESSVTLPDMTRAGYVFAGWENIEGNTVTVPLNGMTVKALWAAQAKDYVVETYIMGVDGTYPETADSSETKSSFTGENVSVSHAAMTGFTAGTDSTLSGTIPAEGTLTLKLYYVRNQYKFTTNVDGDKTETEYYYEAAVETPATPTKEGHTFASWSPEVPVTMPAEAVEVTAQWDVNEHTVTWMADGRKISQDSVQYGTEFNASVTPGKEGHTFVGWTDEDGKDVTFPVAMGDADRTFHAKFTANSYTVTWMADGSKVDEKTYEYGAAVTAPADPEKTGYKFVGWDVEVPATMPAENLTVNAVFTIKQYTVTLMDGDEEVETITADFGSEVTLPTLTKAGYEFAGWEGIEGNAIASLESDMTVRAQWTAKDQLYVVRSYVMGVDGKYPNAPTSTVAEFAPTGKKITAKFETMTGFTADQEASTVEGVVSAEKALILELYYSRNQYTLTTNVDNVETVDTYYFEAPVAAPAKPTKEGYTCTGWDGEIPATMPAENLEFTAQWQINSHTVTWKLGNGEDDVVVPYEYGKTIEMPETPEREGHSFGGWNPDYAGTKMPDNDLESTAKWTVKNYSIVWTVDKSTYNHNYDFGAMIQAPAAGYVTGHTFAGWAMADDPTNTVIELPETMPAKDLELRAVYEPNAHTITWIVDGEETVVNTTYGAAIEQPKPEKEGYTFDGWLDEAGKAPVATMPDSNLTYIAQWTVNAHTVTWMVDGKEVDKQTAEYGTAVKAPEEPEKTGYTFVEWDTTLDTMPDKDVTINGLFTINQYTITFETGEGSAVEAITQNYNTYIRKPANPTREGYTFNGWLKNGVAAEIPGNMPAESYTLTADWAVNSYKIVWNVDGTKTTDEVAYGTAIEQPATPVKEGYTFASWGAEVPATMPAQNLTFVAEWKINTHTVTWDVDGEKTTADYTYGKAISKPAAPTKTGYTFTGWDGEIPATMPAENLEFTAQWQINSHTVTWKQGNGEANVVQTYKYGETIAKPADPEKEGHRFDGWTPGVATTMPDEDLTYTAKWTANSYSLTWKVDGKTEMGRQVYGTAITKKADPVKEGYTFAGWAREDAPDTVITVPATMPAEDLVLVAVWTTNKHTVTWNVDGKLEKETYAFGETPVHADPEKEGWTFTGWTPKVTAMGDADVTYTAAWAINEYTITWNLNNGTEATQTKVTYGDVITAQTPVKEGYKFMGWTVAGAEAYETAPKKMPAEDLTYTANWAVSSYTVTWNVDGKLTKETYAYGDTINVPAEPEKAGYVFDSWAPAVPAVMPAENMTFTAVWENDQYTVTWIVDEAQTTVEYAYGDAIVKPADPVKEGWTFGGWKVTSGSTSYIPNTMPAENLEITAQWTQNKHTVTWDVDGKTTAKTYLYGETVTVPADPEKVGYTFSGWTPTVSQTMGDADVTYTATWTVKSHTITWNVDGRTTEDTYNYGDTIQARTANKAYHIFAGWMNADGAIVEVPATMPDENLIFTVKWDPYDYFITFHANNGTDEKAEQTVEHNVAEKLDANPFTYEGYGFKGWATDKDSTETPYKDTDTIRVTTDMSLYAVWEEGQYTITWNVDGTETTSSCKYGTNIVLPATPTKTGYTFAGWLDEDGNKVTASTKMPAMDLTLTASWNVNYYDVTWDTDGDGDVDDTISVAYGQMPVHADGSRPSGAQFDYTFTGWSPELAAVTGNAAYKAQFTAAVRAYTVTFVTNADGIPVNPVTAQYGDSITLRTLTREGYTFKGWSVNPVASEGAFGSYKITGETTLYAIWSANTYQISFVNEFGDTLTYKQYYGTPVELPEEPVQEGHTFNGWVNKKNPEAQIPETMPAEHLTFVADWTINQYTITFANTGDSKMDPITADYAAAIVIPADPKREGYTFTGWDIDIPETMPAKNLTITAKWERNVYTILWDVNGDGSVDPFEMEVAEQVEHGRWPLEQVGRKAPDAQYTYIFTGWTPEVKEATQDQVYVAQFTTSVNKYTIGWDFNGDGEAEDTTTVSYGAMPAYDAVKKKSDEKYTYTFTGWSPELTEVTGDTMYTAQFEATPVEYTVNFLLDQTGGIYQTVTAGYGTAIAVPENPEKTGYTFIGWDKEIPATMPVGGATLTGLWTINSYTITFDSDGGTEVASIKARFGGAVTAPAAPTRTGYTFAGWQPAVPATMPAENMTLKAQWTPNQYIITFGSNGGSQVEAITQAYGSAVTAPEAPVREGYTFAGWDQDVPATMPAENITLTAQWTPNSYDVRFYTDDSMTELHATVSADCDASFQLPEEPTRAGYNFGGWYWMDQEGNEVAVPTIMPAGGMDAYAKWDIDSFTISFNTDGGSVVESITAEYGAEIFAPADPEKEGYSFDGWDVEFPATMPAQSMTLNAVWKINQYTIRFNTDGGSEIASITQDYNTAVTAPAENPTKAGYTFLGWDAAIPTVMPAWDVTISAQWTPNQYTITFNTNGGSAIDTILADFGSALTEPAAPVKTGYVFAGWDVEFPATMPLDGLTLNAQWAAIDYAIYWDTDGDGEVDDTTNVAYDTMPEHADGAKPATAEFSYVFAGWDPEISLVRGTATYSALFSSVPNTYTITFDTVGGSELEPVTYAYGSAVAEPAAPTKEGYIFTGWDALPATMPAENIVVAAQWRVVDYSITFDSAGGTEVAPVTAGYLTTIAAPNDPTREGYTFTGWTPAFPEIMPLNGMKLTATWAINQYTITFNTNGGSEIAPITQDYGTAITAPAAPVKEGYTFTGWNAEIPATMPAANMTFTAQWEYTYSGWLTDEIGTTYLIDGEKAYYAQWANIDGNDYYFDSEGYIVKGLYQTWSMDDTYEATFVFDKETGVFLKDLTTVYADGEDLYYVENGEVINYPGLVRIVKDDGEINYYYFGADNKVVKDGTYTVTQNNGLLPVDPYIFGADGVIEHHEDTSRNGIHEENGKKYFYIDGVKVHMGLVEVDGEYYYAANGGELICGRTYWITRTNDLLPEKAYTFDEEGKIVFETEEPEEPEDPTDPTDPTDPSEPEEPVKPVKNGIYAEDGSLFYYENDERTYGGLLEINGYFYYAKINGEVIHGRSFWITKTNGLMEEGNYAFDNQGRMILAQEPEGPTDPSEPENPTEPEEPTEPLKNGIYAEDGSLYYYEDGVRTYAGLIEIDGYYYYVRTSGEVVHGRSYWITKTNGILPEKSYTFDDQGRMIDAAPSQKDPGKNGIYEEDGSLYYYEDGLRTYGGLMEIDGDYYYAKTDGEVVNSRKYWITKTNGLKPETSYNFDSKGRMIIQEEPVVPLKNGIYEEDGSLYYYEDGERTYAGLIVIDGYYYYIKTNCEAVHDCTYWITKTNDLLPAMNYTFDEQGRIQDVRPGDFDTTKNGIYKENGTLYYYVDGYKTNAGLIQIDGAYYYAKSDGAIVTGRKYYVAKTNGLMASGYYTFDAEGKMVQ
nr:InlB B-repeat-containing protein [Oscillospiraceae bacterium]